MSDPEIGEKTDRDIVMAQSAVSDLARLVPTARGKAAVRNGLERLISDPEDGIPLHSSLAFPKQTRYLVIDPIFVLYTFDEDTVKVMSVEEMPASQLGAGEYLQSP